MFITRRRTNTRINEVLNVYFFYVGQKHNAKCFCPGELRPNAAKYKPLEPNVKAKRGFKMQHTVRGGGGCEAEAPKTQTKRRRGAARRMKSPSLFAAAACSTSRRALMYNAAPCDRRGVEEARIIQSCQSLLSESSPFMCSVVCRHICRNRHWMGSKPRRVWSF